MPGRCGVSEVAFPLVQADLQAATGPLGTLLRTCVLSVHYQPIAGLSSGDVFAHEALIRGPEGSLYRNPLAMIEAARTERLLHVFETVAFVTILADWSQRRQQGKLFVNLSAEALVLLASTTDSLQQALRLNDLDPRTLVVEITEHDRVHDVTALSDTVAELTASGWSIALDDFGDGRSSLRLWSQLKPSFVKIDKFFTRDISQRAENLQTLQALLQIAAIFDTKLIAEGVETAEDLRALRDLGIPFGQGYFIGWPVPQPRTHALPQAVQAAQERRIAVLPELGRVQGRTRASALPFERVEPVTPQTSNAVVVNRFLEHPRLHALPVVQDETPVGLIGRLEYMNRVAQPYFLDVYSKKPCAEFIGGCPPMVEVESSVDELLALLTSSDQRFLRDGFVVVRDGRYHGIGTGEQVVRIVTEARIEAARHANPLTFLPGNIPLTLHIERLLDGRVPFCAAYLDLNHFKPFNDRYGYWRGDEVIKLLAQVALSHCDAAKDFVGHVGGDDFVVLFQSEDWHRRCERIHRDFTVQVQGLFDEEDRRAGAFVAEDRNGVRRSFPMTSVAIGCVKVLPGEHWAAEAVANQAAQAKHQAKVSGQGVLVMASEGSRSVSGAGVPVPRQDSILQGVDSVSH